MESAYSAKDLQALDLPVLPSALRSIVRKADRENWAFYWESVRGGSRKMYRAYMLPDYVQEAILKKEEIDSLFPVATTGNLPALKDITLNPRQRSKANLKASLVRLYMEAMTAAAWGEKEQARETFMLGYNSGAAYPELYRELGVLTDGQAGQKKGETLSYYRSGGNYPGDCAPAQGQGPAQE